VALLSASMTAPALPKISRDLKIGSTETNFTLSIYILALAFGPLIISPLSEVFGRKPVYLGCHVWFILWNSLCPVGKTSGLLITGRFFSGLGAGGAQAVGLPP
jgi:MFS family permease